MYTSLGKVQCIKICVQVDKLHQQTVPHPQPVTISTYLRFYYVFYSQSLRVQPCLTYGARFGFCFVCTQYGVTVSRYPLRSSKTSLTFFISALGYNIHTKTRVDARTSFNSQCCVIITCQLFRNRNIHELMQNTSGNVLYTRYSERKFLFKVATIVLLLLYSILLDITIIQIENAL